MATSKATPVPGVEPPAANPPREEDAQGHAPSIGYVSEAFKDPRLESIQSAARRDWEVRQNPDEWVRLANGAAVRVQPGLMPSYEITPKETKMLGHPGGFWVVEDRKLMMVPGTNMIRKDALKPPYYDQYGQLIGPRYCWRIYNSLDPKDMRTAETRQLHRGKKIRYVEVSEIDRDCPFAVYTELPAGDTAYVQYFSQILCEVLDPELAYKMHKQPEDRAIQTAKRAPLDIANSPSLGEGLVTSIPGRVGMNLNVTETKTGG